MTTKIKLVSRQIGYALVAIVLVAAYFPSYASAGQIGDRSVAIGTSVASATTSYTFTFTVPSTTAIKSASFQACTSLTGACVTPTGFSVAGASSAQPSGMGAANGWTGNFATSGELRIANAANSTAPSGNQSIVFSSVVNPSATNETFFFVIKTFSDASWTTLIDSGKVATSTAGQITVTAIVDEALTFTLADTLVELGTLTPSTTGSGTSTMTLSTNALSGYTVTYTGDTLTSGLNDVDAMATAATSQIGTEQFGINLVANTTPAVGIDVTGGGTGLAAAGYNTADTFKFNTAGGDIIASSSIATNENEFTTSYIANVQPLTAPGSYSTVITYIATANF